MPAVEPGLFDDVKMIIIVCLCAVLVLSVGGIGVYFVRSRRGGCNKATCDKPSDVEGADASLEQMLSEMGSKSSASRTTNEPPTAA